jgi:Domain of unknown function (DUF1963)
MPNSTKFEIVASHNQILTPITKFGGQPVWISHPHWPCSPESNEQMTFLGQIALNPELFPNCNNAMAYIFFATESEPIYNEAMAIVIQTPESVWSDDSEIEFVSEANGPTIYELDENYNPIYKEYEAVLNPIKREAVIPLEKRYAINDLDYKTGYQFTQVEIAGNKIGGQPLYLKDLSTPPEYFTSQEWLLLMQMAPTQGYWNNLQPNFYPFQMELGEFKILTIFISRDYTKARCYIQ